MHLVLWLMSVNALDKEKGDLHPAANKNFIIVCMLGDKLRNSVSISGVIGELRPLSDTNLIISCKLGGK